MSVNSYWDKLITILNNFKEKHIKKFMNRSVKEVPWLTNNLKKLIKKRNKRSRKLGRMYFRAKYKMLRNCVIKQIRLAKAKYEKKIIKRSKGNRKIFFSYVNASKKGGGGNKIRPLLLRKGKSDEEIVSNDSEMAELLSEFFSSVFNKNIGSQVNTNLSNNAYFNDRLERIKIDEEEVIKIISEFKENKAPGIDGINSTYALKIKHIVARPLKLLFEKSLQIQKVPDAWKKANVIRYLCLKRVINLL